MPWFKEGIKNTCGSSFTKITNMVYLPFKSQLDKRSWDLELDFITGEIDSSSIVICHCKEKQHGVSVMRVQICWLTAQKLTFLQPKSPWGNHSPSCSIRKSLEAEVDFNVLQWLLFFRDKSTGKRKKMKRPHLFHD